MTPSNRHVAIAGATGLVGTALLEGLIADESVQAVHAVGRRAPGIQHRKLTVHVGDFSKLTPLPPVSEVYLALGTTIAVAGSQAAFRAVDFDANLAVARAARAAGARRAGLVSALGADATSRVFYSRVKGELEDALSAFDWDALVIARPSLLVGDRTALGQPGRAGERVFLAVSRVLGPIVPRGYRAIAAGTVARALLARVPVARGHEVLASAGMQAFAS